MHSGYSSLLLEKIDQKKKKIEIPPPTKPTTITRTDRNNEKYV